LPENERPVDHLVLPVTTLTLARSRLTSLGFTVAPDARHPFGTGNCCVFFRNRTFLEPITILDRAAADIAAAEGLVFVKRIKRFTERHGEGFAMVALRSADAEADVASFTRAGIGAGPSFRFARAARLPDGTESEVGFVLAFSEHAAAPDAAFFASQHLVPDVLFQPAYLEHSNGAAGVIAAAAVAEQPGAFRDFLSAATGQPYLRVDAQEIEALVDGQRIVVVTPDGFRARYGVAAPDPRRGLLFAAFELAVEDIERTIGFAGPTARRQEDAIVVPPSPGLGATLVFRKKADG
jgi:hypothetical protein